MRYLQLIQIWSYLKHLDQITNRVRVNFFSSTGNEPAFNNYICLASSTPFTTLNPPEISTLLELIGWVYIAADINLGFLPSCCFLASFL